jgi:hypothetical protein
MLEQQRASRSNPVLHRSMNSDSDTRGTSSSKLVLKGLHATQIAGTHTSTRDVTWNNSTKSAVQSSASSTRITGSTRETLGSRISASQSVSVTATKLDSTSAGIPAANSDSDSRKVGHVYHVSGSPRSEPSVQDVHAHSGGDHSGCGDFKINQSVRRAQNPLKDLDSNGQGDRRVCGTKHDNDISSRYIKSTICTDNRRVGRIGGDLVHGTGSEGPVCVSSASFFLTQGACDEDEIDCVLVVRKS